MSTSASTTSKRPNEDPKALEYQTTHPGNLVIKPSSKNYGPSNTVSNARDELNRYFETHLPKASGGWPMDPNNPWSGHTVAVSLQGSVRTPALLRVADCTHPRNGFGPELVLYVRIPRKTSAPLNLNPGRREDVRYFHVDNADARRLLCNMKISPFDATTAHNGTAQHHPYVLSMLVSMHAIGDLGAASEGLYDDKHKPTYATGCGATAYANGGLTIVCLPPLSAELEKCFILMGHSLAVAPTSNHTAPDTTTSSHDDDAESSTSDDVPLAQQLDAIWGNWKAKSTEAGTQLRACTQELYDLGQHLPRAHASSIFSQTIPKLSSHSAAVGTHLLAEVMDQLVGIATKAASASAQKKAAQSKAKSASAPQPKPKSILQTPHKSTGSKSAATSSSKAPSASTAKTVSFAPISKRTPTEDDDDNDSESWDIGDPVPTGKRDRESDNEEGGEDSDDDQEEEEDEEEPKERPTKQKASKRARYNEGDLKDDDEEDFSDGNPDSDDSESNSGDDSDEEDEAHDSDASEDGPKAVPKQAVAKQNGVAMSSVASSSAVTTLAATLPLAQSPLPKPLAQGTTTATVVDWGSALNLPVMMPELESLLSPASDLLPSSMAQPFGSKLKTLKQLVEANTLAPSVGQLLSSIVVDLVHALHALADRRDANGAVPMSVEEVVRVRALSSAAERLHTGAHPLVRDALRDLRALETNLVQFRQHSCEVTEGLCRIWAPGGALVPATSEDAARDSPGPSTPPEPPEPPEPPAPS
jgi:hypothetical protein